MIILVPSRARSERAVDMIASVMDTAHGRVPVMLLVDPDEDLPPYRAIVSGEVNAVLTVLPERVGYSGALNFAARKLWGKHAILGAFGDDVLFRTDDWDLAVEDVLSTPGIAYGDDLIHGVNHPTAVFMSSVIAKALGYLALPVTRHQWTDDGWKRLGQKLDILRFMPGVIFEHMHPAAKKAEWDDTYRGVFDPEQMKLDQAAFEAWLVDGLEADAEKVRTVL